MQVNHNFEYSVKMKLIVIGNNNGKLRFLNKFLKEDNIGITVK